MPGILENIASESSTLKIGAERSGSYKRSMLQDLLQDPLPQN